MREEVLVLRGQDGSANNGRNVLIRGDLAVFRGHLNERPAVDIVDVTDSGKLKPGECLQVGQIGPIEIDVMNYSGYQSGGNDGGANQKANEATPPAQSAEAATASRKRRVTFIAPPEAPGRWEFRPESDRTPRPG